MPYDPSTILLLSLGRYARDENGRLKDKRPSLAQLPLMHYKSFPYVDEYLSSPEETFPIIIDTDDLEYVQEVARAFGKFPVTGKFPLRIRCQGAHGYCSKNETAVNLVLPWDRTFNQPERVQNGAPERINQTHVNQSYFCCEYCAGIMEKEKESYRQVPESGVIKLDIGFRLPDYLTKLPAKRGWNVDRGELHRKLKKIAYQLTDKSIREVIDVREIGKKMMNDKYTTQIIASKLAGYEGGIPERREDYIIRRLGWHLRALDEEHKRPLKPKRRKSTAKDNKSQLDLNLVLQDRR